MSTSSCRFYENKYPEVNEVVMVNVQQIAEMGSYVKLLEYDNIEGMILLSELSRRRIRSIQKLIRVGKNEVVVVLKVDKEKGYIDLSKRRVSPDEVAKGLEKYNKSKSAHTVLRYCAEKFNIPLETLYQTIGWPLSRKYGHIYDAFKISITDSTVFDHIQAPSEEVLAELKKYICNRLTPQAIKIRADYEVTCFEYDGIDAIKDALRAGEAVSTENLQVKVKLVAAPQYVMTVFSYDKQEGIDILEKALKVMTEKITAAGGDLTVTLAPKAVTASEDAKLQALLESKSNEDLEDSDSEFEE